ncbi:uncharacterized protein [Anolis sagrei]|uniref:uncharacterized protein isoform X2 n=1 Tax=Anolis sagrei TaxID=38937 RepID=UPI00352076EF
MAGGLRGRVGSLGASAAWRWGCVALALRCQPCCPGEPQSVGSASRQAAGLLSRAGSPGGPPLFGAPGESSIPPALASRVVDLRSDTVTRPSPAMRQAMARAEVGQDDYGEDPTVNELQRVAAELLGMEEALFVPTTTMANLIAVMCHCHRRGAQVLLGKKSHIHVFEQGGVSQVAGVHSQLLQDLPNGTFCLDEVERKIQESHRSKYHPRPELICLENTHCSAGGRVLPLTYLQELRQLSQRYRLRIHMDGARLLNAAVALGVPASHISQHCDSISLCLSKGVGAPVGSLLVGSKEFISDAWRVRKLLGGGMCQAGVLAAAGLVALSHVEETLQRDHSNARCLCSWFSSLLHKSSHSGDQYCHGDIANTQADS